MYEVSSTLEQIGTYVNIDVLIAVFAVLSVVALILGPVFDTFDKELARRLSELARGVSRSAVALTDFASQWMHEIWGRPFSTQGIVVSCAIAFAYTLAGALWSWSAGAPQRIGDIVFLPEMPRDTWPRVWISFIVVAWFVFIIAFFWRFYEIDERLVGLASQGNWWWDMDRTFLVAVIVVVSPFALGLIVLNATGLFDVPALMVFVGASAGFVVALLAVGRHPGIVSVLFAFALAVAPLLLAATGQLGIGWLSLLLIGAFAGTAIGVAALAHRAPRLKRRVAWTQALVGGSVGAIGGFLAGLYFGLAIAQTTSTEALAAGSTVAFVSICVPILNGVLDWVSVSLTMLLLVAMRQWLSAPNLDHFTKFLRAVGIIIVDIALAFSFVGAVQGSLAGAVMLLNVGPAGGAVVAEAINVWRTMYLEEPLGRGFVITVMSWSTVVPTMMHLFAVYLWILGLVFAKADASVKARSLIASYLALVTLFASWIALRFAAFIILSGLPALLGRA